MRSKRKCTRLAFITIQARASVNLIQICALATAAAILASQREEDRGAERVAQHISCVLTATTASVSVKTNMTHKPEMFNDWSLK